MKIEDKLLIDVIEKYWPQNVTEEEIVTAFIAAVHNLNNAQRNQ